MSTETQTETASAEMTITLANRDLVQAIGATARARDARGRMPCLNWVTINPCAGGAEIGSNNLDRMAVIRIAARVEGDDFTACVDAKALKDALAMGLEKSVSLRFVFGPSGTRLHVNGMSLFCGVIGDAAPDFSQENATLWHFGEAAQILNALKQTRHTESEEVTRFLLCGSYFTCAEKDGKRTASVVSTDGRAMRLVDTFPCSGFEGVGGVGAVELGDVSSFILPSESVELLIAVAKNGPCSVTRADNHVFFEGEGWLVASKHIDGNYPNYSAVIPSENKFLTAKRVKNDELETHLKRHLAVNVSKGKVDEKTQFSTKMEISEAGIKLTSVSDSMGTLETFMECAGKATGWKALVVALNPRLALNCIYDMPEGEIEISAIDGLSPVRFISSNSKSICMPVRLS